jgi:hypothetical protein
VLQRRDTEEEFDPNHRPLVDSRPFFIETRSGSRPGGRSQRAQLAASGSVG